MPDEPLLTRATDPTSMTTEQLKVAILALRETMEARLDGMQAVSQTRFEALKEAADVRQRLIDKIPTDVDLKIDHAQEISAVKFEKVEIQFQERDKLSRQANEESKDAVKAALASAKEAVNKSEGDFAERIKQQEARMDANERAQNEKFSDIKAQLSVIDGKSSGVSGAWGIVVAVIGLCIGGVGIVIALSHAGQVVAK